MRVVDIVEAETILSQLVDAIENGTEGEIVLARHGRLAARLVRLGHEATSGRRLGLLRGVYPAMAFDDFDAENDSVRALFEGGNTVGDIVITV